MNLKDELVPDELSFPKQSAGLPIFCLSNFNDNLKKILSLMRDPVIGKIEAVTVKAKFRQDEGGG
jgi:hypothetical protein